RCNKRMGPDNGAIDEVNSDQPDEENQYRPGEIVKYVCDNCFGIIPNADGIQDDDTMCTASGWDGQVPKCQRLTCAAPELNEGVERIGTNNNCGATASFTCKEGYVPADATLTCVDDGSGSPVWSGTPLTCKKKCPFRMPPENGAIDEDRSSNPDPDDNKYNPGDSVYYRCNTCYKLDTMLYGSETEFAVCGEDGNWNRPVPTCQILMCMSMPPPEFGGRNPPDGNNNCNDDPVTFYCDAGYGEEGPGVSNISCIQVEDGVADWDNEPMTCGPRCSERMPPLHGSEHEASSDDPVNNLYKPGQKVTYECDLCYRIKANELGEMDNDTLCTESGWDGDVPNCELMQCESPLMGEGVLMVGDDSSCGQTISFQCKTGYIQSGGEQSITCQSEGTTASWSGVPMTCRLLECLEMIPNKPLNGDIDTSPGATDPKPYTPGNRVSFICDTCYQIGLNENEERDADIVCGINELWDGSMPVCELVTCSPEPQAPMNGGVVDPSTTCGQTTTYTCDICYRHQGSVTRTCQSNGNWSPINEPTCELQQCAELTAPANGMIVSQNTDCGGSVVFSCDFGYELKGSESRECKDNGENVEWTGTETSCEVVVCPFPMLPPPPNGGFDDPHTDEPPYEPGDVITIKCDPCYEIDRVDDNGQKDPDMCCQLGGFWDNATFPNCQQKICTPSPSNPVNGDVSSTEGLCGDDVTYTCDWCYRISGGSTRQCTDDFGWVPLAEPVCEVLKCDKLMPPQNGRIIKDGTNCKSTVEFECEDGFELSGNEVLTCIDNGGSSGVWDGAVPTCEAIECPEPMPFAPVNGSRDANRTDSPPFNMGEIITYRCDTCYQIKLNSFNIRDDDILCQSDGTWDSNPPECERKMCDPVEAPENGFIIDDTNTCNKVAKYGCNMCYKVSGTNPRLCADNGWATQAPQCQKLFCPALLAPLNGEIVTGQTDCNSTMEFTCNDGFTLVGKRVLTCLPLPPLSGFDDADWNGDVPICERITCPAPMDSPPINGIIADQPPGPPYQIGAVISYKCDECYRIAPNAFGQRINEITCLIDGTWDKPTPTCEHLKCEEISDVLPGGNVLSIDRYCRTASSTSQQGEALYECDEYFVLTPNTPTRVCTDDGNQIATWKPPTAPECVEITTCDEPSPIADGTFEKELPGPVETGKSVTYSCNGCYKMVGEPTLTCVKDEITSERRYDPMNPPQCERITCNGIPMAPVNGSISSTSNDCLASVHYECNDECLGLIGVPTRTCLEDGTWDHPDEPVCVQRQCIPPAAKPEHGLISSQDSSCGAVVSYSCETCYTLVGPSSRTCTVNGWDEPAPTCEITQCEGISDPQNGKRYPSTGNENCGQSITFTCNAGYILDGAETITCTASGEPSSTPSWSQQPPVCKKNYCEPAPQNPLNGNATPITNTVGTIVTYTCDSCYAPTYSQRTCNANPSGDPTWSPVDEPTCELLSCSPVTIANGNLSPGLECGVERTVTCDSGYYIDGPSAIRCIFVNGSAVWNTSPPACKARCINMMPTDPNVEKDTENSSPIDPSTSTYGPGDTIMFKCRGCNNIMEDDSGIRDPDRICLETGKWDNPTPPECEPKTCEGTPSAPVGGTVDSTSNTCGTTVTYSCLDSCDQLSGAASRICQPDGTWTSEEPTCIRRTCNPKPTPPLFGSASTDENTCGTNVTYSCDNCYELTPSSSTTRSCGPNGQWAPEIIPTCEVITCVPLQVQNGIVSGTNNCGMTVQFECVAPYFLEGPSSATCREDGTWSGPTPECIEPKCPYRMPPDNGAIDPASPPTDDNNEYARGSVVYYSCDECFGLMGQSGDQLPHYSSICRDNGTWSTPVPTCERLSCMSMSAPENGMMTPSEGNNNCNDGPLTFSCDEGYGQDGPGSTEISCVPVEGGAAWSDQPITCSERCEVRMPPLNGTIAISSDDPDSNGQHYPGDRVVFACDTCYRIQENIDGIRDNDAVCTTSGWDDPVPTCELLQCMEPMLGDGVVKLEGSNDCLATVSFECEAGYIPAGGDESITCVPMGNTASWNGSPLTCKKKCPYRMPPDNGFIDDDVSAIPENDEYIPGDVVVFGCETCYKIGMGETGPMLNTAICLDDGTWSAQVPQCQRMSCISILAPEHGTREPETGNNLCGDPPVVYGCSTGYEEEGTGITQIECVDIGGGGADWTGDPLTCGPMCNARMEPVNGAIDQENSAQPEGDYYNDGDVVYYTCNDCFKIKENQEGVQDNDAVCVSGQWDDPTPTCEPLQCEALSLGDGVIRVGESNDCQTTVSFYCKAGYIPSGGNASITCVNNNDNTGAFWNGTPLTCKKTCRFRMGPENGGIDEEISAIPSNYTSTSYLEYIQGDIVYYKCNDCYKIDRSEYGADSDSAVCGDDGNWNRPVPTCQLMSCMVMPPPNNGTRQPATGNNNCNDPAVVFSCDPGFGEEGPGVKSINCVQIGEDDAEWDNMPLTCGPRCDIPMPPTNGGFDATLSDDPDASNQHSPGDTVTFTCDECYIIAERESGERDNNIVCTNSGWDDDVPTCEILQCEEMTLGEGVIRIEDSNNCQSTVNFQCAAGYAPSGGDSQVTCMPYGTYAAWSGTPLTCDLIQCMEPMPSAPENGFKDESSDDVPYIPGNTIKYGCDDCFKIAKDSHGIRDDDIMCQNNGQWDGQPPSCEPINCMPPPQAPLNGGIDGVATACNATTTYMCDSCYRLQGQPTRTCQQDGTWSPLNEPTCQLQTCTELQAPVNGRIVFQNTECEGIVTFECNFGYELEGSETRVCQDTGTAMQWSGVPTTCEVKTCPIPMPPLPPNGGFDDPNTDDPPYEPGEKITYTCDTCYEITRVDPLGNKDPDIECELGGTWSNTVPDCHRKMCTPSPINPSNGLVSTIDDVLCGDNVTYTCNVCYRLSASDVRQCTDSGWSPIDIPTCEVLTCDAMGPLANGLIVGGTECGSYIELSCDPGYKLIGESIIYCTDNGGTNGEWDGSLPFCQKIECPEPMPIAPENGSRKTDETDLAPYEPGDMITYQCDTCYQIEMNQLNIRDDDILCQSNGTWDSHVPACERKMCDMPTPPNNGLLIDSAYYCGEETIYGCDECYKLVGENPRHCADSGWLTQAPQCQVMHCLGLTAPVNGFISSNETECGVAEVQFSCEEGFNLIGVSALSCVANGNGSAEWNGEVPVCQVSCDAPMNSPPTNGSLVEQSNPGPPYPTGTVLVYRCDECFRLPYDSFDEQLSRLTCLADGSWSNDVPTCERKPCHPLDPPPNGLIVSADNFCGGMTVFAPQEGFQLLGPSALMCLPDGTYDDEPPTFPMAFGVCRASGDPHYWTFDGIPIHFQCACKYLLVGSLPNLGNPFWQIYVQNVHWNGQNIGSWTRDVEIVYNGDVIELLQGALATPGDIENSFEGPTEGGFNVQVNGENVTPGTEIQNGDIKISMSGLFVLVEILPLKLTVKWDGSSRVIVILSETWKNKVEGICQNFNGNPSDDMRLRNGMDVTGTNNPGTQIGNSYQVNSLSECACSPQMADLPTCVDYETVKEKCSILGDLNGVFGPCISELSEAARQNVIESCQADMCADQSRYCEILEDFAASCAVTSGPIVAWRNETECPTPMCPFPSEYNEMGSACPNTCVDPNAEDTCTDPPVEGCFCPPNFILSGTQCVPDPFGCGCVDSNGYFRTRGSTWFESDCSLRHTCEGADIITTEEWACRSDEICGINNGVRGCMCPYGFILAINGTCIAEDKCASMPCQNGGTCVNIEGGYSCICPEDSPGDQCEGTNGGWCDWIPAVSCDPCVDGSENMFVRTCTCPQTVAPGLSCVGVASKNEPCDIACQPCLENPCLNGGVCVQDGTSFTCDCLPGYTGVNCEFDISACSSAPCKNDAQCVDVLDPVTGEPDFVCECISPFSGKDCSTNLCTDFECVDNQGVCVVIDDTPICQCYLNQFGERFFGAQCESINGGYCLPEVGTCTADCGGGNLTLTRRCDCPTPLVNGAICSNGLIDTDTFPCNTQPCPIMQCGDEEAVMTCPEGTAIGVVYVAYGTSTDESCTTIQEGCSAQDALVTLSDYCALGTGVSTCTIPSSGRDAIFYGASVPQGCESGLRKLTINFECISM
ncbi:unnamed protein product, partial [Owenia fusiformis]